MLATTLLLALTMERFLAPRMAHCFLPARWYCFVGRCLLVLLHRVSTSVEAQLPPGVIEYLCVCVCVFISLIDTPVSPIALLRLILINVSNDRKSRPTHHPSGLVVLS